jgi:hypothetical protein
MPTGLRAVIEATITTTFCWTGEALIYCLLPLSDLWTAFIAIRFEFRSGECLHKGTSGITNPNCSHAAK